MKLIFKSSIVVILFVFFAVQAIGASNDFDETKIKELVKRWEVRDGAAVVEISYEFSKSLVANDSVFFKVMLQNKNVFNSWLEDLQYDTFTAYAARDEIDDILYTVMLSKLKDLMLEKTNRHLKHPNFGKLAIRLEKKLKIIQVRLID